MKQTTNKIPDVGELSTATEQRRHHGAVEELFKIRQQGQRIIYRGHPASAGAGRAGPCVVERVLVGANGIDGPSEPLDPRHDLRNHSPDGFQWGYSGSGPAQLALAILADALDDETLATTAYQRFKVEVIGRLHQDRPFQLDALDVRGWAWLWGATQAAGPHMALRAQEQPTEH